MAFEKGNQLGKLADHSKRKPMTQALIAELNEIDPVSKQTRMRKIIRALIENAEAKDNQAIVAIFDRVEGKPAQALVGEDGAPLIGSITVTFVNP